MAENIGIRFAVPQHHAGSPIILWAIEFEDRGFPYINVGFTNDSDELMTSVMKNLEQLNPGARLSSCRFAPNKLGTFRPIGDEKEGRLTMTSARGKARTNKPQEPFKIHGSN